MTTAARVGRRARTQFKSVELTRRALNEATICATIAAGASFVLILLGRLPYIGVLFALLQLLVGFAAYPVAGFLVTARLHRFFHGPTRTLLAFHFGLGAATAVALAIALASLVGGLLVLAGGSSPGVQGVLATAGAIARLVLRSAGEFFPHLIAGTLLAALGSFIAFDRDRLPEEVATLLPKA